MSKHTEGPWIAKEKANYSEPGHVVLWLDRSKGGVHSRRIDFQGFFTGADANLIAAAPELLLALEGMLQVYGGIKWDTNSVEIELQDLSRAAIAKARGNEQ